MTESGPCSELDMRQHVLRSAVVGLIGTLILSGCAHGQTPRPAAPIPSSSGPSQDTEATTGGAPVARDWQRLPDDTPLAPYRKYLEGPQADAEKMRAELSAVQDARESIVSGCMKQAGFDYFPVPFGGSMTEQEDGWLVRGWMLFVPVLADDRDTVEKWGYGTSAEATGMDDILGDTDPKFVEATLKNQEYQDSLSATARKQYNLALVGAEEIQEGAMLPDGAGCFGQAHSAVPGDAPSTRAYTQFMEAFEDLRRSVVQVTIWDMGVDPRAVALDKEWATCMAAGGTNLPSERFDRDPRRLSDASLLNRFSPATVYFYGAGLDQDGREIVDWADGQTPAQHAYPAQVEIALADFDCREELDYMNRIMAIQIDVEQAFVDSNKVRLDELESAATRNGY